jgi:macrolide-specific efflux system membrane fusion protein
VLTATVTRQDVEQTVLASGVLQAIEQVDVGAQVSGQVTYLAVEAGNRSSKESCWRRSILIAQNNLKTAEAELASRRAQLKIKQAQLKQNELAGAASSRCSGRKRARARIWRAPKPSLPSPGPSCKAPRPTSTTPIKVERAKTELGYNRIQAPMDGTVVSIVTRQGQTLAASQTVPTLLKLANLDTMTVKAQISEADVTRVKAGMPVYFTLIGDPDTAITVPCARSSWPHQHQRADGQHHGHQQCGHLLLRPVRCAQPGHQLRVAMTTQVTIVLGERKQVLAIPQTALGKKTGDNEYEVSLLKAGDQKETRRIKTGMKDDIKIEVVSGLTEQDKVILEQGKPALHDDVEMEL